MPEEGRWVNHEHDTKYILLVDDNEDDVRLFREAAGRSCKAEVFRSSGGEEAINLLAREEIIPSLIVLEIDLPSADGYALLRFVREHSELHTVPVVILTGILSLETLDPAWAMGANAVILKPKIASELRELVKSMCEVWLRFAVAPRPLMAEQL
jgi:CheY-like chemotaxis protein